MIPYEKNLDDVGLVERNAKVNSNNDDDGGDDGGIPLFHIYLPNNHPHYPLLSC